MNDSVKNSKYGLNRGNLKMIALFCMALDHFSEIIIETYLKSLNSNSFSYAGLTLADFVLRSVGRLAFPIFCFFIVEGFFHTRSVFKYALRLALLGIVSEVPYDIARFRKLSEFSENNVFWTLLIGLVAIYCIDGIYSRFNCKKALKHLSAVLISLLSFVLVCTLKSDYAALGVAAIIIIYLTVKEKYILSLFIYVLAIPFNFLYLLEEVINYDKTMSIWYYVAFLAVHSLFWLSVSLVALCFTKKIINRESRKMYAACFALCAVSPIEFPALADVFLMKFYNGEKGKRIGWLFYLFYPLHLLALAGLGRLLKIF